MAAFEESADWALLSLACDDSSNFHIWIQDTNLHKEPVWRTFGFGACVCNPAPLREKRLTSQYTYDDQTLITGITSTGSKAKQAPAVATSKHLKKSKQQEMLPTDAEITTRYDDKGWWFGSERAQVALMIFSSTVWFDERKCWFSPK